MSTPFDVAMHETKESLASKYVTLRSALEAIQRDAAATRSRFSPATVNFVVQGIEDRADTALALTAI